MKTRVIAAVVLLPVLLAIILAAPTILTALVLGIVCIIAAYEFLCGTGLVKHIRLIAYTGIIAFFVPLWCHNGMSEVWALVGMVLFFVALFSEVLISHGKLPLEKISLCVISGLFIPYMLSALVRIIRMDLGRQLICIPFVVAFLSDSGAYFLGKALGRHKLAPVISPNKSIEGLVGGMIAAILGMLIYCFIQDVAFGPSVNYPFAITYGILGSLAGVFGDLCFSAVKRQTGIKDYGNLIPGHGGILDRFDSLVVVAPLVEILLALLPVVE